MIVTKDSPIFGQIGGMHTIDVNTKGLPTLKAGGPILTEPFSRMKFMNSR
jgi:hypothetical protein